MSENQKFYEEFLRNFNLTTPTPLLALEYETLTSTQTISTISGQYASTKGTPTPTFEAKELDLEAFSWMYWTPFILDAVVPALVFSVFYLFRVICIVLFKIAKLKARHPKVPFSQTLYYSVFATAIVGKHLFFIWFEHSFYFAFLETEEISAMLSCTYENTYENSNTQDTETGFGAPVFSSTVRWEI